MTTPSVPTPQTETERDRVPHFRSFRNLSKTPTPNLERVVDVLGAAIVTLEATSPATKTQTLRDALAECERELICREIARGRILAESEDDLPAPDVVRVPHRLHRFTFAGE